MFTFLTSIRHSFAIDISSSAKWQGSMDVAVKVQNTTCVTAAAFLDEAQILKTLQHPNIIELRGVCCNDDCDYSLGAGMSSDDSGGGCGPPPLLAQPQPVYLLTEYMPRGQLSRYLRDFGSSLALSQLIHIGAQVCNLFYRSFMNVGLLSQIAWNGRVWWWSGCSMT